MLGTTERITDEELVTRARELADLLNRLPLPPLPPAPPVAADRPVGTASQTRPGTQVSTTG